MLCFKHYLAVPRATSREPGPGTCLSRRPVLCSAPSSPASPPWTCMLWLSPCFQNGTRRHKPALGDIEGLPCHAGCEALRTWCAPRTPECVGCEGAAAVTPLCCLRSGLGSSASPPPPACPPCRQLPWEEGGLSQTLAGHAPLFVQASRLATCC